MTRLLNICPDLSSANQADRRDRDAVSRGKSLATNDSGRGRSDVTNSSAGQFHTGAAAHVLGVCDCFQMIGVDARRDAAEMVDFHSPWDSAFRLFVGETVSMGATPSPIRRVAMTRQVSSPVGRTEADPTGRLVATVLNGVALNDPTPRAGLVSLDVSRLRKRESASTSAELHDRLVHDRSVSPHVVCDHLRKDS